MRLEKHEYDTVIYLIEHGYDIELIPPSFTKGQHTADLLINGVPWEMKSPTGSSNRTIERILKRATKQSGNVIIDLRRIKISSDKCLKLIAKQFSIRRSLRQLKIITKTGETLDFQH